MVVAKQGLALVHHVLIVAMSDSHCVINLTDVVNLQIAYTLNSEFTRLSYE